MSASRTYVWKRSSCFSGESYLTSLDNWLSAKPTQVFTKVLGGGRLPLGHTQPRLVPAVHRRLTRAREARSAVSCPLVAEVEGCGLHGVSPTCLRVVGASGYRKTSPEQVSFQTTLRNHRRF